MQHPQWWLNAGVGSDKSYKNSVVCEVSWGDSTDVAQIQEMLNQRLQDKKNKDYLLMGLIIFGVLFGWKKKIRENISDLGFRVSHLQNLELTKWLHMEECRFSPENILTGDLAYSWEKVIKGAWMTK